jgi:hypothetical protein
VWARKQVSLETCPKSYVTGESESLVEAFFVRRRMHAFDLEELSARQVEAFVILEKELLEEMNDSQHNPRHGL